MRTEGIGLLKISKDSTGNRIWNLPSCGAIPQPTAPLAAVFSMNVPVFVFSRIKKDRKYRRIATVLDSKQVLPENRAQEIHRFRVETIHLSKGTAEL
jgi:hypothetical protein